MTEPKPIRPDREKIDPPEQELPRRGTPGGSPEPSTVDNSPYPVADTPAPEPYIPQPVTPRAESSSKLVPIVLAAAVVAGLVAVLVL